MPRAFADREEVQVSEQQDPTQQPGNQAQDGEDSQRLIHQKDAQDGNRRADDVAGNAADQPRLAQSLVGLNGYRDDREPLLAGLDDGIQGIRVRGEHRQPKGGLPG